jgi:lipoate-protein ligase A
MMTLPRDAVAISASGLDRLQIQPYPFDQDLLTPFADGDAPRLRIERFPATAIVLGHGSRPERELYLDRCRADEMPIFRRRGGGCAVVLDPGNLIVSLTLPLPGLTGIRSAYDRITGWLISSLARVGVSGVHREGVSDLALEDRKIGGACIYRQRGLLHYTATLLIDPDIELAERYLPHPPREPAYRRGRSHRAFMGALARTSLRRDPGELGRMLRADLERDLERKAESDLERQREAMPNRSGLVLATD